MSWYYKIIVIIFLFFYSVFIQGQHIVINEFLASNQNGIEDEDGDASDWIELYNADSLSVNLSGFSLSDGVNKDDRWYFPEYVINPGEFILIWASGKDRKDAMPFHTDFKLSSDGENVLLYETNDCIIDSLSFGPQEPDVSYGRFPDGSNHFTLFNEPTPGSLNIESPVVHLVFSHESGLYSDSVIISVTSDLEGTVLKYTLDGEEPDQNKYTYSEPLLFESTTVLRVCAYYRNKAASNIESKIYIIDNTPELPVLSVIIKPEDLWGHGIYDVYEGRGKFFERPCHITLIEDKSVKFSVPAGLRIHGDSSRNCDKKSFRLYFREEYGLNKLEYPLFPQKTIQSFKRLVLYSGSRDQVTGNSNFSMVSDVLTHSLWFEEGGNISAFRPVVVYLNRDYWGIYWIRERIDKHYVESHFRITDIDLQQDKSPWKSMVVKEGSGDYWYELFDFINSHDLSNQENYEIVKERYIDIHNYIDYHIINVFAANYDWLHMNVDRYRDRSGSDPRFKWIMWDTDAGWRWSYEMDCIDKLIRESYPDDPGRDWCTVIPRNLLQNTEFLYQFINRFADLLNTTLSSEHVASKLNSLVELIRPEMTNELDRWGNGVTLSKWESNIQNISEFISLRPYYQRQHIIDNFSLSGRFKLTVFDPVGDGRMSINSLTAIDTPWEGHYFMDIPITVRAIPHSGWKFHSWTDSTLPGISEINLLPSNDISIQARFVEILRHQEINIDVISDSVVNIQWQTNVPAISRINYGITNSCELICCCESGYSTDHHVTLGELLPQTNYYYRIVSVDALYDTVTSEIYEFQTPFSTGGVENVNASLPDEFEICQNYPNPFNMYTEVPINLSEPGELRAIVYNLAGQEVKVLFDDYVSMGLQVVKWNGTNKSGEHMGSGLYFVKIYFQSVSGLIKSKTNKLILSR